MGGVFLRNVEGLEGRRGSVLNTLSWLYYYHSFVFNCTSEGPGKYESVIRHVIVLPQNGCVLSDIEEKKGMQDCKSSVTHSGFS